MTLKSKFEREACNGVPGLCPTVLDRYLRLDWVTVEQRYINLAGQNSRHKKNQAANLLDQAISIGKILNYIFKEYGSMLIPPPPVQDVYKTRVYEQWERKISRYWIGDFL